MKSLYKIFSICFLFSLVLITSCGESFDDISDDFGGEGKGGSTARFTFLKGYLYIVDETSLKTIDISQPDNPQVLSTVNVGPGIETIFPYENFLFLGSQTGMYIYSLENGPTPTYLSLFEHSYACDPVVVANNIAYVTLRSGTACATGPDRMEVVDVTNLSNPSLITTIEMINPHGLAVNDTLLFVGEGEFGFKVFNIKNRRDPVEIAYYDSIPANDMISINGRRELIITGEKGIFQYNYADIDSIYQMSQIVATNEN
ncbi:LVIVD repeat-containing protein [Marivirga atlantica]|uniref:LVIVD repeat-containing protein n=1 Tax=Marivirga atlantica TaxID=1548457 RepID=A0A937DJV8_9BACT|nr:hypothetical protein [Marivirga atlantica]MBL0765304.1 hypothetical protein [Marivirga atlantica]